jgi:hypothetical protein
MAKNNSFDDFYSHQPRKLDKKKHHARGFNEEIHDQREQRVNFKNYIRQLREQEVADDEGEEWLVERGVMFDGEVKWTEIESFLSEQEAMDSVEDYRETDTYGDEYRVRRA